MARLGQFRRDTFENWARYNPIIADGEFILVAMDEKNSRDYDKFGVGDGKTKFRDLLLKDWGIGANLDLTINNNADEEDIGVVDKTLKFKDKEYSPEEFSGLGRVYLRKNIVDGKNILTKEMINKPNTLSIFSL